MDNTKKTYTDLETALAAKPRRWALGDHLYLDVRSPTSASWFFWYRFGGPKRELGIGSATGVGGVKVSEKQARAQAAIYNGILAQGDDPAILKVRGGKTFADLLEEEIVAREQDPRWGERAAWLARGKNYLGPVMKRRPGVLSRQHFVDALQAGWKSNRVTAERALYVAEAVMKRAQLLGHYPEHRPNPAEGASVAILLGKGGKKDAKQHASIPHAAAPAWMVKALAPKGNPDWRAMGVRRKALVVAATIPHRAGEIHAMKWDHIDFATGVWTTPAEDNKRGHEQVNKLPWQVVELIRSVARVEGNPFVFASPDKPGCSIAAGATLEALREMGVTKQEGDVHGFRSTMITYAGDVLGIDEDTMKDMLSHKSVNRKKTKGESLPLYYRPDFVAKRADTLQKWADYLFPASFAGDNVVTLQAAAA